MEPIIKPALKMTVPYLGPTTRSSQESLETLEQQTGHELRYKKKMDMYFKGHIIYRDAKKDCEYYDAIQIKLQDKIQAIVIKQKAARL